MPRVTDEQIAEARNITLLAYFQSTNPGIVKHQGGGRYVHKEHDSFVIDNGKGQWYWNSQSQKGHSSLDYLMRVEGMGFIDAVQSLTGGITPTSHASRPPPPASAKPAAQEQPKPFALPKSAENNNKMIMYLSSRGISDSTARKFINQGLLYESANNSCVFVGRDSQDENKPKYAAERSMTGDGKKDALGSDKAFNFCLPPDNPGSKTVAVFESPIDALSHHEIMKIAQSGRGSAQMIENLLADFDGHRLSLAGTASVALTSFLERNPDIENIYLCLDSDKAGEKATERIVKELLSNSRFADMNIIIAPPPIGKDYSETLTGIRQLIAERNNLEKQTPGKPRKATHIREAPGFKPTRPAAGIAI